MTSKDSKSDKVGNGVCPFCGGATSGGRFCKTCMDEGFDKVYAVTGRSNGWERAERKKVSVKSGWRGRRIIAKCFKDLAPVMN